MKIAIIPARKGSKRIKNKNIKLFFGKPIIYWSIKAAKDSKLFDKIIVSTDCKIIANIANKFGAETPFVRPKNLSGDVVNVDKVIKHALLWYKKKDIIFDKACCIYPTAPFLSKEIIRNGLELIQDNKKFFSFTVTSFPHPIERSFKIKKDGSIIPKFKNNEKKRSQLFEVLYHDIGQIYWGMSEAFLKEKNIFAKNSSAIYIPRYLAHDINTIEEWKTAELIFKALKLNKY